MALNDKDDLNDKRAYFRLSVKWIHIYLVANDKDGNSMMSEW